MLTPHTPDRTPITWRQTLDRFSSDHARLRKSIGAQFGITPVMTWLHPGTICVFLFRVAHYCRRRGYRLIARLLAQLGTLVAGGDFHPDSDIGEALLVQHPTGVALIGTAGRNLTVMSRSGTGMLPKSRDVGAGFGLPLLGDDCIIGPCCGIEGPQRIGNRVRVLTGVALMQDTPDDTDVHAARPGAPGLAPGNVAARPELPCPCGHGSLRSTLRDFGSDLDAYQLQGRGRSVSNWKGRLSALLTTQSLTLGLYRLSHYAHANGFPRAARAVARFNRAINRATINPASCVGGGWYLPHPTGVVFNACAGKELVMFAYVIVASKGPAFHEPVGLGPALGDNVVVGAHSCILGPVRIGDNVRLGFSVHVAEDIAADRIVVTPGCRAVLEPRETGSGQAAESVMGHCNEPRAESTNWRAVCDADWARLLDYEQPSTPVGRMALRLSSAWTCVRLFRASRRAFLAGRRRRAQLLWQVNMLWTGADMRPWSSIGPGLLVPYPPCVSLGANAGRNLTVLAMAGIDRRPEDEIGPGPPNMIAWLGDDVTLEHHSGVLGPVRIGDGALLTMGARVTADVEKGEVLVHARSRAQRRNRTSGPLSVEALQPDGQGPGQASI